MMMSFIVLSEIKSMSLSVDLSLAELRQTRTLSVTTQPEQDSKDQRQIPHDSGNVGDQSIRLQHKRKEMRWHSGVGKIVTGKSVTVPSCRQSVEQCNRRASGPAR